MGEAPTRFLDLEMPALFDLEVPLKGHRGEWIVDVGSLSPQLFARLDDGSYLCAGHGSHPVYLRVAEVLDGGVIRCLDGGGESFLYRLRAVKPSDRW
ncbi:MAG: hypothetical protein WCO96_02280 [Actinomycetes bacterium]